MVAPHSLCELSAPPALAGNRQISEFYAMAELSANSLWRFTAATAEKQKAPSWKLKAFNSIGALPPE